MLGGGAPSMALATGESARESHRPTAELRGAAAAGGSMMTSEGTYQPVASSPPPLLEGKVAIITLR